MSTDKPTEAELPLELPRTTFNATLWAFVAVSGITLTCRLAARFRGQSLFWDDGLVIFSWILSLITAALWQWAARDMYYLSNVQAGLATPDPNRYMSSLRNWLNTLLAVQIFFYTILLCIKLSFLIFFHRLGSLIDFFRYIWWPVLVITVGSYLGSIGSINYKCFVGTVEQITVVCQTELEWTAPALKANAALDVVTDFMIMLLPTILVWNIRITWPKKLALMGLFWLSILTIVTAIVRAVTVDSKRGPGGIVDASWLWFLSAIEPSVAIMVCCGSAFPQLFRSSTKKPEFSPSETFLRMRSRIRSSGKRRQMGNDTSLLNFTRLSQNSTTQFNTRPGTMPTDNSRSHGADPELERGR